MKLSDRQAAALFALADLGSASYGDALTAKMCANGRETSIAAAHQAASGLAHKNLVWKVYGRHSGEPIRYELTEDGWALVASLRGQS